MSDVPFYRLCAKLRIDFIFIPRYTVLCFITIIGSIYEAVWRSIV